ncbi:filamentous hemagglutinin N-terminal domain-containing protein [Candidatus Neptunochlamydia vexilliferae]|uniref:Ig-like domain-containing protein n=1 Tax=Candidatus Neptunichlamydia vexilliferae TaxID=1651774 RepID=A0ABS0AXP9_9BACT|nr:filamentous hemagglutinin N-terminal domain-containing protein [Candidatus Neptunochlamydia vexilliferae]MBF5058908.1 hypothetical protein [Candidatus Neptunochlamydia vexilliferae]
MKWFYVLTLVPLCLLGQPKGLDIRSGQLTFKDGTVTQTSAKAIAHWDDFSVGKGETLRFVQPSKDAAILNRVVGKSISQILGSLKANGNVILINPNGVYISGDIQTAGFIASTADISNENFLNGKELQFGPTDGEITNAGHISCPGGDVYLIAKKVDNSGEIEGHQVVIRPHNNPKVLIRADDTDISSTYEKAISHTGTIRAFATKEEGGKIYLVAFEGTTEVDGTLIGDEVHVLGQEVTLKENTHIDASGPSGGTVLIGGDYQGANPDIFNAQNVYVAKGAEVKANSTGSGDGGKVIYWSDGITTVCSHTSVRGGPEGGNGGFVEVSSRGELYYGGTNDSKAPCGKWGEILFDPSNVNVAAGADTNIGGSPNWTPTGVSPANLTPTTLQSSLNSNGAVTLTTASGDTEAGTLTFTDPVTWGTGGAVENASFTCTANSTITFNAAVTNNGTGTFTCSGSQVVFNADVTNSGGNFNVNAGSNITVNSGVTIQNSGAGGITFKGSRGSSATEIQIDRATISTVLGAINLNGTGVTTADGDDVRITGATASVSSTSGAINIKGQGDNVSNTVGLEVSEGARITSESGDISFNGRGGFSLTSTNQDGILLTGTDTMVSTTGGGSITLVGNGRGAAFSQNNMGVVIASGAQVTAATTGKISITGTGGSGIRDEKGVYLTGADVLVQTDTGDIKIVGTGRANDTNFGESNNEGIMLNGGVIIRSAGGAINLTGRGPSANSIRSPGIRINNSSVANSGDGTITMYGQVSRQPTSDQVSIILSSATITGVNGAISITGDIPVGGGLRAGGGISCAGGTISTTGTGTITLIGRTVPGARTTTSARGGPGIAITGNALISNTLSGVNAPKILLNGRGSVGRLAIGNGIYMDSGTISTTSGEIELIGSCRNFSGFVTGVFIANGIGLEGTAAVSSTTGAILFTGTGLDPGRLNTATTNAGITIAGGASISSNGGVTFMGTGSTVDTASRGIALTGGTISTTSAPISLTGVGGTRGSSLGIFTSGSPTVTSATGAISITGSPNATAPPGTGARGISMTGGTVSLTGAGSVTMTGTGSSEGGTGSHGISMSGSSTEVTASDGSILIDGVGGGSVASNCDGIVIQSGAKIRGTSTASVTLVGIGGVNGNTFNNDGIAISGASSEISIASGALSLAGTGGGTTTGNKGIRIDSNGSLIGKSGAVNAVGIGGSGTSENDGIFIINPISSITAVDSSSFNVTGRGMGSASPGRGIFIGAGGLVETTGSGTLTLDGIGNGIGSDSYGVEIVGVGTQIENSGTGILTLIGRENGATKTGLHFGDFANVNTNSTGSVTLQALSDLVVGSSGSTTATGTGTITFDAADNLFILGGASFGVDAGLGRFIAGADIDISEGATFIATSGNFTFVVDNDFPTSPLFGPGTFNFTSSTITTPGEVRIYTSEQSLNSAAGETINGEVFNPGAIGVDSATEKFGFYFPGGTYGGGAFNFYYKVPSPVDIIAGTVAIQREIIVNLKQLPDLLPVLKASRLPYQFPNFHFSICTENGVCSPSLSPYGSFIFEDDVYWIGISQ